MYINRKKNEKARNKRTKKKAVRKKNIKSRFFLVVCFFKYVDISLSVQRMFV